MSKLYKSKKDKEIYYYFLKNGEKRWMYRHKYYDSLGERKEKKKSGFKTEDEALKALLELKASILSNGIGHLKNMDITVSKWFNTWFKTYNVDWKLTTKNTYQNAIYGHIIRLIGNQKLNHLNRATYKRMFINTLLKEGYNPSTIQYFHRVFMTGVNAAVRDEVIPKNRFHNLSIEKRKRKNNFLTPEELDIFLNAALRSTTITEYSYILLLAYTGIRAGEGMGLKWKNVNFKENLITIERTRDQYGTRTPKTKNSYRTIKIDSDITRQLKKYRAWCIKIKLRYGQQLSEDDFVFINGYNAPFYCSHYIFKRVYKFLSKQDIKINRITPHGLRHTHATILINEGVPPQTVAKRLGNSVEMIYQTYVHSHKELEEKAVSIFSSRVESGAGFGAK